MTNEEAIEVLEVHKAHWERLLDNEICDVLEGGNTIQALNVAIQALQLLDKLDGIITEQIDLSYDQVECQTLRWVLDKISEEEE